MLPVTLINSLQALARSATPLIVADNTPPPAGKAALAAATQEPPLAAGQQVQATIQEQLSPGLFKVLIAGQTVQMQLPAQLKVGNVITLKVESTSPGLTLSFLASTTPLASQEQISPTSRLLANLADLPLARTLIESSSGRAVWQTAGTPPDSKLLAAGLRDALANSGLFYESHQAQWVAGERSTTAGRTTKQAEPRRAKHAWRRSTRYTAGSRRSKYAQHQPVSLATGQGGDRFQPADCQGVNPSGAATTAHA
jgi:hypothetical protein